jgi:UDP-N-acetylglucosamine--N-acetylmuramyl-(pentapeptide) pyrophosphoryl-undecaprenol N-acetylglucosamine transferase
MKVMIAGGGTGGHLFTGVAVALALKAEGGHDIRFVGTRNGLEARVLPKEGWALSFITVGGLKRMGLIKTVLNLFKLPLSLLQSLWLVLRFWPDVVMGVGGYASGPVLLAAWLLLRPTLIVEQNSRPGVTNRILGRLVRVVVTHFRHAETSFPANKVRRLGNPVRMSASEPFTRTREITDDGPLNILITGGSQGAHAVNMSIIGAMSELSDVAERIHLRHQCGPNDVENIKAAYARAGIAAQIDAFIDDMAQAYLDADLVIARAGAGTVTELGIVGRAALFIPLPTAADDHQSVNASELVEADAAWVIPQKELTPDWLAQFIRPLIDDRSPLRERGRNAAAIGKPDAARDVVRVMHELSAR